jgi:hypothetical protein
MNKYYRVPVKVTILVYPEVEEGEICGNDVEAAVKEIAARAKAHDMLSLDYEIVHIEVAGEAVEVSRDEE